MSTHVQGHGVREGAPSPLDVGQGEYVDNPVVANLSPRYANALSNEYNLNFEPYSRRQSESVSLNKDVKGSPRRHGPNSNYSDPPDNSDAHMDLRFQYAGPNKPSDERHYFKTIQTNYEHNIRSKRGSLDDLS